MQFKHPEILCFLALLIIPILVHLFHLQRFVKVPFTNVAFLQKIVTQTRKSSQLKKWLILATRLLTLAAIVVAFAQPYFSNTNTIQSPNTLFYIDNSLSLQTKSNRGNSLEVIKQDIAETITENGSYTLLTNTDFYTNLTALELKEKLSSVKASTTKAPIETILLKINNQPSNQNTLLISDFQNIDSFPVSNLDRKKLSIVQITPEERSNLSIDSVFVDASSNQNLTVKVLVSNQGASKDNVPIALYNAKQLVSKQTFSIQENTTKQIEFTIQKTQDFRGKLVLNTPDAFRFDNTFYFSIDTKDKINVLAIGDDNAFLSKIYTADEFNFTSSTLKTANYNSFNKQQLIIVNELETIDQSLRGSLIAFVKSGGALVIIPNANLNIPSYNLLLKPLSAGKIQQAKKDTLKITRINFKHPLFKNVFKKTVQNFEYPTVYSYVTSRLNNQSNVLQFDNNQSFISQITSPNLNVYVVAASLQKTNSNFTNSPLIVPVFYSIGKQSLQLLKPYYTLNGQDHTIEVPIQSTKKEVLQLHHPKESFIPLQQALQHKIAITITQPPNYTGFYEVVQQHDTLATLACNADTSESSLRFLNLKTLGTSYGNKTTSVKDAIQNIHSNYAIHWLWQWFLALAIVSLLLEILILKFYKT